MEQRSGEALDPLALRDLRADCGSCFGLCCVALPFARSADFAVDKPAGKACGNLRDDFRCGVHDRLRTEGFSGCTVYDCFGAGQKVSQGTFGGESWRIGGREVTVVWMPYNWGFQGLSTGASVNHLTIDAADPGAGTQETKACLVNVVKAGRPASRRATAPRGRT